MVEGREPDSETPPPWMCCVAEVPPTASREPAAWRDPDLDTAVRELVPSAKKEELDGVLLLGEVRKPDVTSTEISGDVKCVPGIVDDVGFAFITEIYLSIPSQPLNEFD